MPAYHVAISQDIGLTEALVPVPALVNFYEHPNNSERLVRLFETVGGYEESDLALNESFLNSLTPSYGIDVVPRRGAVVGKGLVAYVVDRIHGSYFDTRQNFTKPTQPAALNQTEKSALNMLFRKQVALLNDAIETSNYLPGDIYDISNYVLDKSNRPVLVDIAPAPCRNFNKWGALDKADLYTFITAQIMMSAMTVNEYDSKAKAMWHSKGRELIGRIFARTGVIHNTTAIERIIELTLGDAESDENYDGDIFEEIEMIMYGQQTIE